MLNPNRQFKEWYMGEGIYDPNQPRNKDQPFWKQMLLCLPKNLVYVFIAVVVGSFFAMSFITYSEKDLKKFMEFARPNITETDALYLFMQDNMVIDKYTVPEEDEYNEQTFIKDKVSKCRPVKYKGYAQDWTATKKWSIWTGSYLMDEFSYTQFALDKIPQAPNEPRVFDEYKADRHRHSSADFGGMEAAIEKILKQPGLQEDRAAHPYLLFADDVSIQTELGKDVNASSCPIRSILSRKGESLSIYPAKIKRRPSCDPQERFICVLEGKETFKMMSPVFKQNIYQGVYDDIHPEEIPTDVDLFNISSEQFPLLALAADYILTTTLEKGDCVYIPALFWTQSESQEDKTMIHTQRTDAISRMADLLFEATDHADLFEKKEEF